MKKLHFFGTVSLALLVVTSNLYSQYPKLPLMERWTGASCSPCADYNRQGYELWTEHHRNELAIITWHTNASGPDPVYTMDHNVTDWRTILYNRLVGEPITAVPEVKWNGKHPGNPDSNPDSTELNNLLSAALLETTPMKIEPTLTIDGDVATVHVKIHTTQAMDNIKLRIVLVEAAINFAVAPGYNGERVFPYVAKFLVPDSAGTSLTLAADETWEQTFTQDSMTSSKVTHADRMYAVVFVEEMTKEHNIVQAALSCETIPYPAVYEARTQLAVTGSYYHKLKHKELITHTFELTNVDDYEITVIPTLETYYSGQEGWAIIGSDLPTARFNVPAKTTQTYEISVVHNGDKASGLTVSWELDCIMSEAALAERNGIALNNVQRNGYIDLTEGIKYAYLTGMQPGDQRWQYAAFNLSTLLKNELIEIPSTFAYLAHPELFYGNFLDSLKFLGFGTHMYTWMTDIAYDDPTSENFRYKYAFINKLKSMTNTRMFMSWDPTSFFFLQDPRQFRSNGWDAECDYAVKFVQDNFGIISIYPRPRETIWNYTTEDSVTLNKAFMEPLFWGTSIGSLLPRTLIAEDGDSISLAKPSLTINSGAAFKDGYLVAFDSLTENASSVYNYYQYIYTMHEEEIEGRPGDTAWYYDTDQYGKYNWRDSVLRKNVMVKWDKDGVRRVTSGFNFAMIAETEGLVEVAESIVNWLFAPVSIQDGETNMSTKNGLLLKTYPNPVTSVSDVIVQNINTLPVLAKVYVLDMSGAHVLDLFSGTLNIGDNNITLSNSSLPAGKYFVVSETTAGKTFMSVVISK